MLQVGHQIWPDVYGTNTASHKHWLWSKQLGQCDPSKTLFLNFKPIYWNLLHSELRASVGDLKLLKSLKAHYIILNI